MEITDDVKLRLILGEPLSTKDNQFKVRQFTIGEISEIGYSRYNGFIGFICMEVDALLKLVQNDEDGELFGELYMQKNKLSPLDLFLLFSQKNDEFKNLFIDNLCRFLILGEHDEIVVEQDRLVFRKDETVPLEKLSDNDTKLIEKDTFEEIVDLIKVINRLNSSNDGEPEGNPYDKEAEKVLAKLKANRERVAKLNAFKKEEDKDVKGLSDIISALTVMSPSINKLNVKELTFYQLFDEYNRLYVIENYRLSTSALMFGGSSEIADWSESQS